MSREHDVQVTNISIANVKHPIRDITRVYLADFVESGTNTITNATLGEALSYANGKQLVITPYLKSDGSRGVWQLQSKTYDLTTVKSVNMVGECNPIIELQTNTSFKIGDGFSMSNIAFNKSAPLEAGFQMAEGATVHFDNVSIYATGSVNVGYGVVLNTSGTVYFNNCTNLYACNTVVIADDDITMSNCIAYYNNCVTPAGAFNVGLGCTNYMTACKLCNSSYYGSLYATGCAFFPTKALNFAGLSNVDTKTTYPLMVFTGCAMYGVGIVQLAYRANTQFIGCNFLHVGTPAYTISSGSATLEGCKIAGDSSLFSNLISGGMATVGHCLFDDGIYPA